jgi:hypothetical protein
VLSLCKEQISVIRHFVPTAVVMKSFNLWHITPCSRMKFSRRFGGKSSLRLQGWIINQETRMKQVVDPLIGLFFDSEERGGICLWNVGWLSTDYKVLYPKERTLHKCYLPEYPYVYFIPVFSKVTTFFCIKFDVIHGPHW